MRIKPCPTACLAVSVIALLLSSVAARAQSVVGSFSPIYKGIDLASGTNFPNSTITRLQVARCVRIDLSDPDVQLFTTPPSTIGGETLSLSVSNHVKRFGLAVSCNANSYNGPNGTPSPSSEGLTCTVDGLLVCTGRVVSAADNASVSAILFTTNKQPTFASPNYSPGISTTGIFTAVTGFYPVLTNSVCPWTNSVWSNSMQSIYTPGDNSIHQAQPRTVFGFSQDRRYMFLVTVDGRQPGYSEGALDGDLALWLLAFGATDAINMDGGGSTAMYMADCAGNPIALNHSSYPATTNPQHERYIGAHFGVSAAPLSPFVYNVGATGASTTATITWSTLSPADSRVEYGLSASLGSFAPIDPTLVTSHTVILSNLTPSRQYYYRVSSSTGTETFVSACANTFVTTNPAGYITAYSLTNAWRWQTNNMDGSGWQANGYNDSGWSNNLGLFWADNRGLQTGIPSATTRLPVNPVNQYPFTTYYFRTHFNFPGATTDAILTLTNYFDDGMVIYLNGAEVNRINVPAGTIVNSTAATGAYCSSGNATCPYVLTLSGSSLSSLRTGDNVIAVELHNVVGGTGNPSPDATFGQSLSLFAPGSVSTGPIITNVFVAAGESNATIVWQTVVAGNSLVQYGTNSALSLSSPLDPALVTNHLVILSNLLPVTQYNYRISSSDGSAPYTYDGVFSTIPFYQNILPLTATWHYTTNDVSADAWTSPSYDDFGWPQGSALLYVENNSSVDPRNTLLPSSVGGSVFPTYYFRTRFTLSTNSLEGFSLIVTNFIDDGAIFYLNGREVSRIRMPSGPVGYGTLATGCPLDNCDATPEVPDVFRLAGDALTNLVVGENVLAAEVHQLANPDVDVVFGSSIGLTRALVSETKIHAAREGNVLKIWWAGSGLTLQHAAAMQSSSNYWLDVVGPVKTSPYFITNPVSNARFYRLRN